MMHQFDELAKELAGGVSRREALKRVGVGLAGALLTSLGLGALASSPAHATDGGTPCLQTCNGNLTHCQATIQPNRKACEDAAYAAYLASLNKCGTNNACKTAAVNAYNAAQQQCTANAQAAAQACNNDYGTCSNCCHTTGTPNCVPACVPDGGPCFLSNPGACCSGGCSCTANCSGEGVPTGVCIT